jgi:polar amino acid transport system substrate-binding protein
MRVFVSLLLVLFSFFSIQAVDKTVKIAAGLSVEPYIFKSTNSGIELDIVREALALEGYKTKFIFQPLKRTKSSFRNNIVDAVLTVKQHYPEVKGAFFSEPYITYHNFIVSLRSKNLKIDSISDLKGKSIVAFQQASLAFGREFQTVVDNNRRYRELANQLSQVSMLFAGRADAIVIDRRIFNHICKENFESSKQNSVTFHRLFEPSHFRLAFKEKMNRDIFNSGLKKLKATGRYEKIVKSYSNYLVK